MIPGGSLCVFCIGMAYTGEKMSKKGSKNVEKIEEKCKILHEWVIPWSSGAGDWSRGVKKTFPIQK